jgi:hypothetical protein
VPTENAQSRLSCADRGIVKEKNRLEKMTLQGVRLETIEEWSMG